MIEALLLILSIAAVAVLLLLLAPLRFSASGSFSGRRQSLLAVFSWFPFGAVRVSYSPDGIDARLRFFFYRRDLMAPEVDKEDKKPKSGAAADSPGEEPQGKPVDREEPRSASKEPSEPRYEPRETHEGSGPEMSDAKVGEGTAEEIPPQVETEFLERIAQNRWIRMARNGPLRRGLLGWLKRLCLGLLRSVTMSTLELRARAGFGDFAQTGRFAGYFEAVKGALQLGVRKPVLLEFTPLFEGEAMQIDGAIDFRTSLVRVIWPLVLAAATFPYVRLFLELRARKRLRPA